MTDEEYEKLMNEKKRKEQTQAVTTAINSVQVVPTDPLRQIAADVQRIRYWVVLAGWIWIGLPLLASIVGGVFLILEFLVGGH